MTSIEKYKHLRHKAFHRLSLGNVRESFQTEVEKQ